MKNKFLPFLIGCIGLGCLSLTGPSILAFASSKNNEYIPEYKVYGYAQNVIDGYLDEVIIKMDNIKVAKSDTTGFFSFNVTNKDSNKLITFEKNGYECYEYQLGTINSHVNLDKISLDYPYLYFGETKYKSTYLYSDWIGYSTRGLSSINFKFISNKNVFLDSENEIDLFIDTGDVTSKFSKGDYEFKITGKSQLFVYDFGKSEVETDISIFNLNTTYNNKTIVTLSIPYEYLGINYNSIIGVNFCENITIKNIISDFVFDGEIVLSTDLARYARLDKFSTAFQNNTNNANPKWMSKEAKKELLKDLNINFADPELFSSPDADNIYAKLTYKENSLQFKFVGFGYLEDNEYIKCVIHSSENVYYGWGLDVSDIIILFDNKKLNIYTSCSNYFDTELNSLTPIKSDNLVFRDCTQYFMIDAEIDLSYIKNIKANTQGFRYSFAEFGNRKLYSPNDFNNYIFVNKVCTGDIAGMNAYVRMKSPFDNIVISKEEKNELTNGCKYSFANPEDTFEPEADDMFLNVIRGTDSLNIHIIGFGTFQIYETIKMVIHPGTTDGKNWRIMANDTSIMFNKNVCKIKTGITDFWQFNLLSNPGTYDCSNEPIFNQYENYFTIDLEIPYNNMKLIRQDTEFKIMAMEMDFIGNVYNGGTCLNEMRYNGIPCGDPAQQSSYANVPLNN